MFKWKKEGSIFNPIVLQGKNWMYEYAQAPSAVIFPEFLRVFFASRPAPENGLYVSRMAFIDLDRSNLFKVVNICKQPILELGRKGTFDEFGTYPISVAIDGEQIRAYYAGWTRCESVPFNAAIGLAISNDGGESFHRLGEGPVLSYTPDEPFVIGSPKVRKFNDKWYLWYSAGKKWVANNGQHQPIYKIRMAVSDDGVNWEKQNRDLIADVLESNECQASADVFFYRGKYHMFFSYRYNLDFRSPGRGYKIGYASSTDLLNWKREDNRAGITMSEYGWDSESVSYPFVFVLDEKVIMLYQGNEIGRNGFGFATLDDYTE